MPIQEVYDETQEMTADWTHDNGDGRGRVWKRFQGAQQYSMVKASSSTIPPEEIQDIRMNLCHF